MPALRARPLEPPPQVEQIRKRLAPEAIAAKREETIRKDELELQSVVEQHDAAVREKFHLERYISILEGYDPTVSAILRDPRLTMTVSGHIASLSAVQRCSSQLVGPYTECRRWAVAVENDTPTST